MALNVSLPFVECTDESSDGIGSDEILVMVAVLPVDASIKDSPPIYLPFGRQFLFFFSDNVDAGDKIDNVSEYSPFTSFDNMWLEILVVIKEIDSDESPSGIAKLTEAWTDQVNDLLPLQERQGNPDQSGRSYMPIALANFDQDGNETLGVDIFHISFSDTEIWDATAAADDLYSIPGAVDPRRFLTVASNNAGEVYGAAGSKVTPCANGENSTKTIDDVRTYRSNRNDSTYELTFRYALVPPFR